MSEAKKAYYKFVKCRNRDFPNVAPSAGDNYIKELEEHKEINRVIIKLQKSSIKELEEQNKKLRCCGNCEHYDPCNYDSDHCIKNPIQKFSVEGDEFCDNWMENK